MTVSRSEKTKPIQVNIAGSSVFGRYPKISQERTFNMFVSDGFIVPYAGYKILIPSSNLGSCKEGRAIFSSIKFNCLFLVMDNKVFKVTGTYNQQTQELDNKSINAIGNLQTTSGVVYITENNKPQVLISDNSLLYIYDPTVSSTVQIVPNLNFKPGYITFHDTYFIAAASDDQTYTPPANNTWRLSLSNQGYENTGTFTGSGTPQNIVTPSNIIGIGAGTPITFSGTSTLVPNQTYYIGNFTGSTFQVFLTYNDAISNTSPQLVDSSGNFATSAWPPTSSYVGLLQTKPDNVQAVVRFPSRGNMIFVMGKEVTESWFNTGAQLFPYQRQNQYNIDYGCLSPATVAYMDELVVWLAANERSGPVIMASDGGTPRKITTDGIDYLFSTLQYPESSEAFMYRQDGHLFYHINFYADNFSLFYDFNTDKFYNASDQNLNYFIAAEIAFYGNQYYFVSRNSGNFYAFDTEFTTYNDTETSSSTQKIDFQIPRIRICKNVRLPTQDYFIANDIGFTIESGETDFLQQEYNVPAPFLLLNDQNFNLLNGNQFNLLGSETDYTTQGPSVFLSVSYDGGAVFGNEWEYELPTIGLRRNRLMWWQLGICNDFVAKFRYQGIGRFVATDGVLNIRS